MVQSSRTHLDASFAALSDATRRGVLEQLGRADSSIKLGPRRCWRMRWRGSERYRQLWDARFGELDEVIEELKRKEKLDGTQEKRVSPPA